MDPMVRSCLVMHFGRRYCREVEDSGQDIEGCIDPLPWQDIEPALGLDEIGTNVSIEFEQALELLPMSVTYAIEVALGRAMEDLVVRSSRREVEQFASGVSVQQT